MQRKSSTSGAAQKAWSARPLAERISLVMKGVDAVGNERSDSTRASPNDGEAN